MPPASAGSLDDPPAGLIPTSTTLAKVRALYARAHTRETTRAATTIEEWRLIAEKLSGVYRVYRLGKDERDVTSLGPFISESGVHGGTFWQQTRNGITFNQTGYHGVRDEVSERAWLTSTDARETRLVGESVSLNAYVVEVAPAGGRHEWLFIDKQNGYIVRRDAVGRSRRVTTTYDDFRTFDGLPEPSRVRTIDSDGNERDQQLVSRTLDLTADPKDVDITPTRRTFVEFPAATTTVRLPVRFVDGLAVVRVRVGLHTYDFLLDSGAAGIVVDPTLIDDQRLDTYGSRTGSAVGTYTESASIVPVMWVGALRMRSVAVRVVNVPLHLDDHTKISGLLGFDFFADSVIHLDEDRGIAEAIVPAGFRPPSDVVSIPIALDDKTPEIRARADNVAGRMVLDTGANRSIFTSSFASRADVSIDANATLARFRSVGGTGTAEAVHLKSFDLGGLPLNDPLVDVSSADLGTDGIDGTIGSDLFHDFELYFDYRTALVHLRRTHKPAGPT